MRLECIEFKRCCFCIPLRYGLLATGYFKLVLSILMLWGVTNKLVRFIQNFHEMEQPLSIFYLRLTGMSVLILVILGDAALSIMFIVGGHKKDPKLLKFYYHYLIVIFGLFLIAFTLLEGFEIYTFVLREGIYRSAMMLRASVIFGFINLGLQAYTILLLRSEIAKLVNNRTFRFVNNATESECTMVKELCEYATNVKSSKPVVEVKESNVKSSERVDTLENENEVNDPANKNGIYIRLV